MAFARCTPNTKLGALVKKIAARKPEGTRWARSYPKSSSALLGAARNKLLRASSFGSRAASFHVPSRVLGSFTRLIHKQIRNNVTIYCGLLFVCKDCGVFVSVLRRKEQVGITNVKKSIVKRVTPLVSDLAVWTVYNV